MAREIEGSGKRRMNHKIVLAKSLIKRSKFISLHKKKKQKQELDIDFHIDTIVGTITIDIYGLLFSPQRDFLIKNNGHKVSSDDLKGKTIVLYIVPLNKEDEEPRYTLDMIDAYYELLPMGDVEFVFVAVQIVYPPGPNHSPTQEEEESYFHHLFSTMPFPTIPFSDKPARDRVIDTFRLHSPHLMGICMPYWAIINPANMIVATVYGHWNLFRDHGGAELYPFTRERIRSSLQSQNCKPRKLLNNLDQLLASPGRDYLLSSNGDKVPISSLKYKVIGLYFCSNKPDSILLNLIKKVYGEAKQRGYDFEIVQTNFHFRPKLENFEDQLVQCHQNIDWLTLPFKDPSRRKLLRIFINRYYNNGYKWEGDFLVIVDQRERDTNRVLFEFSGREILQNYGIEGYPFTRQSLFKTEYNIQKESVKLKLLFPPGECHLIRPAGGGCDLVDGSLLSGKSVLVLFASYRECKSGKYVSMLKTRYCAQLHNVKDEEESKFEIVYVPSDDSWMDKDDESLFYECIKEMPWLVYPYSKNFAMKWMHKIFKSYWGVGVAAFNVDGELMAKESDLNYDWELEAKKYHKLPFSFIPQNLEDKIRLEVQHMCKLDEYYTR